MNRPSILPKPEPERDKSPIKALFLSAADLEDLLLVAYGLPSERMPSTMLGLVRDLPRKSGSIELREAADDRPFSKNRRSRFNGRAQSM
jgi:hypothetical protein